MCWGAEKPGPTLMPIIRLFCPRARVWGGGVQGTVIRSGAVKMLEVAREYRCQNKSCGAVFSVHSDMSQGNLLAPPVRETVRCTLESGNIWYIQNISYTQVIFRISFQPNWDRVFSARHPRVRVLSFASEARAFCGDERKDDASGEVVLAEAPRDASGDVVLAETPRAFAETRTTLCEITPQNPHHTTTTCVPFFDLFLPYETKKTSCPGVGEKQCKGTRFVEHGEHKYSDYQEVTSMFLDALSVDTPPLATWLQVAGRTAVCSSWSAQGHAGGRGGRVVVKLLGPSPVPMFQQPAFTSTLALCSVRFFCTRRCVQRIR